MFDLLCVDCLEARIGRMLARDDFPDVQANRPSGCDSARLRARRPARDVWATIGPESRAATRADQHPESRGVQGKHPDAPGRTRTSDPLLRRQPLCPAELRGRTASIGRAGGLSARACADRRPEKKKNQISKTTAARST